MTTSPLEAAEERRRRALADISAGRASRAVRLLAQALELAGNGDEARKVRVGCLLTLATARLQLVGVGGAMAALDDARSAAGDDLELITRWHTQRALVLGKSGDLAGAEAEFERVTPHLHFFSPHERCAILLNRGMVAVERGRPGDAVAIFHEGAALAAEAGLARQQFMALHNAGYAAYLTGDLPAALAGMDAADAIDADVFRGTALLDRGRVLYEAGLLDEALIVLGEARVACGRRGHPLTRGEIDLETARVLMLLGDPVAASRRARSARGVFGRAGATGWVARASATHVAARLAQGTRLGTVVPDIDHLIGHAEQAGDIDLLARAVCLGAELAVRMSDPDRAATLLARHPSGRLGLAADLTRSRAEAALALATDRPDRANRILVEAASALASSQAVSASLESRAARAVLGTELAKQHLGLALTAADPSVTVTTLERWSVAGRRLPIVRPPADAESAERSAVLRSLLRRLRDSPGAPEASAWSAEVTRLRRHLAATAHAAPQQPSAPPRSAAEGKAAGRRLVARLDRADRDAWWLFGHDDRLWVTGLSDGRPFQRPVADLARVRELVRRLQADLRALPRHHGPLRGAIRASMTAGLDALSALVPRPARGVVVVECPEVAGVPWSMVPSLRGVPITVARAFSEWLDRRREGSGTVSLLTGPGLDHDAREVERLRPVWATVTRADVDPLATTAGTVAALRYSEVVHVAAHGHHEADSPLFSSLRLHDGDLFAHELQQGSVRAGHIVLSACDVASVSTRPGGEPLGLAGALVSLGATSVVASVAPVSDEAAPELMARHHAALVRGMPSDAALAIAAEAVPEAATFVTTGSVWRFAP